MISYINPLKTADKDFINELHRLCDSQGICGCRLLCLFESYGAYGDIIDLWVQYIDGRAVSAAVKYGSDMTLVMSDETDTDELKEFSEMSGAVSVSSDRPFFGGEAAGAVMELGKLIVRELPQGSYVDKDIPLNEAYELMRLCSGRGFLCPSYEDFLLDTSHKQRHGNALCCGIYQGKELCSFAMTSALTENTAVIGAVCTRPSCRNQGYGGAVVYELIRMLGNRRIMLAREIDLNEDFYNELGFYAFADPKIGMDGKIYQRRM